MKKILILLIISLIFNIFMSNKNPIVNASGGVCEIVLDQESGRVLHSVNADEKRAMASTTKIVTCITVLDNYDINQELEIKKEWTGIEGSSIYLKEGERYTVEDLLYGLMLRSGNDSAVALANGLSGSIERFAVLMNKTAIKCGAENSSFVNPHGLDDDQHYTTAYDLAMITRYAMHNEKFSKIVSSKKYLCTANGEKKVWYNKNKMLNDYEFATGVKTGYTKKAGRCLVSSSNKNNFKLICVVLNCGPMFERSSQLLNQSYNSYNRVKIVDKEKSICEVLNSKNKLVPAYLKNDLYYPLTPNEEKELSFNLKIYPKEKILPKFGQECGTIEISFKKRLIFEQKIYTILE